VTDEEKDLLRRIPTMRMEAKSTLNIPLIEARI
jgi:hypothetical protein